uniref:OmpA family protein n=1 Tax=Sphingomonas sp. TaxID=28214 RepID=UPI0035C85768
WLLGATTEKQRKGIADYFAPTLIDTKAIGIGGGGLLGGESITSKNQLGPKASSSVIQSIAMPTDGTGGDKTGSGDKGSLRSSKVVVAEDKKAFESMRRKVMAEIAGSARLSRLAKQVRFVMTSQGLRIDLVDNADYSMFALGTTVLQPEASQLVGLVADAVKQTGNPVMIRGHTDSVPYGDPRAMNNWMLSTGRAEATRRRLALAGIPEARFSRIEGVADREPLVRDDATDPRNRRVAITLLFRQGRFGE